MTFEVFFEKCTPDSVVPIKVYLLFMKRICNETYEISKQLVPTKLDGKPLEDLSLARSLYFIYILCKLNSDVGVMIRENSNSLNKYIISIPAINILTKTRADVLSGKFEGEIKEAFRLDNWFTGLIMRFVLADCSAVSIERIFYNLVTLPQPGNIANLFEENELCSLKKSVLELAKVKEKYDFKKDALSPLPKRTTLGSLEKLFSSVDDMQVQVFESNPDGGKPVWRDATREFKDKVLAGSVEKKNDDINLGIDLTEIDYDENPLVGRVAELRTLKALVLDPVKSTIIYGKPGVGKTTLIKGLAYQIKQNMAHPELNNKRVYELSAAELIAGTKYRGTFEERLLKFAKSCSKQGNVIWFIDEIHTIMGLGQPNDGALDASNILKPFMSEGNIKIIGGTTPKEYGILERDAAFERRFNAFELGEPKEEEIFKLLENYISRYEKLYSIGVNMPREVTESILRLLIELSKDNYQNPLKRLSNPDLSLTLLNLAYDFVRLDCKDSIDVDSLIEGVGISDRINEEGKKYFIQEVQKFR